MKHQLYAFLGIALSALTACSDLQEWDLQSSVLPIELDCSISQINNSRANDSGFVEGDAIGVFIVDYENGNAGQLTPTGAHANNVKFTLQNSNWIGSTTLYWKDKYTTADFYSYYPYDKDLDNTSEYAFSVSRRQDTEASDKELSGYEQSDFLWSRAENQQPLTLVTLSHRHIMSSIELTLIEGEGFSQGEWAEVSKAVTVLNTSLEASIDLSTGDVKCMGSPSSIIPYSKGLSWRCIVVPQTIKAGLPLLQISIDGDLYAFSRNTTTEYLQGKLTKFAIKVDKHQKGDYEFTLVSEAILPWENDTQSHKTDTRAYITINVPEKGHLSSELNALGLNLSDIKNLKITGQLNNKDFIFIKDSLPYLEAINLKEVTLKDCIFRSDSFDENTDDCIPAGAFKDMISLKHIVLPDKLKMIGDEAFYGTSLTQQLDFPEGLTHIGEDAFWNGTGQGYSTIKVSFPSTLIEIGTGAFYNCGLNQQLVFPEGLTKIGTYAFYNCEDVFGTIHIPEGLKSIESQSFSGMTNVSGTLNIPGNITNIDDWAFESSTFSKLYLNEGIRSIGNGAFYNKSYYYHKDQNLPFSGDLVVPSTVIKLGSYAFSATGFNHIYLPDNFEELPDNIFADCSQLMDTIKIPSKVNHLGERAFANCENISVVILPENLISIDESCFSGCWSLSEIKCLSKTPPTIADDDVFGGLQKNEISIVVPEGCVEAYREAQGWKEFKRISVYKDFVCRPQSVSLLNKGQSRNIILNADAGWTVTHLPSWVHISKTSGTQKTELKVTIDDLAQGSHSRSDSIVFSLNGTTYTTRYTITQHDSEYIEDSYITLQKASHGNGIDLVFLGDGYDAADISNGLYIDDMANSVEYFFDVEPFKTYRSYFNVYTIIAMSNESGIGTLNTWRDVKFNTNMGDGCTTRMSCNSDAALFYAIDNSPVSEDKIDGLTCLVIANITDYDGITYMYSSSPGDGAAVALCPKSNLSYPFDARGLIQHEGCGHAFGKLADEYIYHGAWIQNCNCSCCEHVNSLLDMHAKDWGWNMSLEGTFLTVPWKHLIADNRYNDIVDIYEGGFFHSKGVYRSESNSCMNNNVPYFSTWSRELMVRRIKRLAGENFDYEEFVNKDSRTWGKDFTTNSRAIGLDCNSQKATYDQSPIIINHRPSRPK